MMTETLWANELMYKDLKGCQLTLVLGRPALIHAYIFQQSGKDLRGFPLVVTEDGCVTGCCIR